MLFTNQTTNTVLTIDEANTLAAMIKSEDLKDVALAHHLLENYDANNELYEVTWTLYTAFDTLIWDIIDRGESKVAMGYVLNLAKQITGLWEKWQIGTPPIDSELKDHFIQQHNNQLLNKIKTNEQ